MAFGRVVAKDMPDSLPDSTAATNCAALQGVENLKLVLREFLPREGIPDVSSGVSFSGSPLRGRLETYRRAAKLPCTGVSSTADARSLSAAESLASRSAKILAGIASLSSWDVVQWQSTS